MLKDYARYVLLTGSNIVVSYLLLVFLANILEKSNYAYFGLLSTILSIALIFVNQGHKDALFKFSSRSDVEEVQRLGNSAITWTLASAVFFIFVGSMFQLDIIWAGVAFCSFHLLNLLTAIYRGQGRYKLDGIALPMYRALWLLLCWLYVYYNANQIDHNSVFAASLLASIICLIALNAFGTFKSFFHETKEINWPFRHPTLRNFFFIELVTVLFMKSDLLILKLLGIQPEGLADYFFSLQVFEASIMVIAPIAYLVFNQLNESKGNRPAGLKSGVMMLLVVAFLALFLWVLLGEFILEWMFPEYLSSYRLVWLLLLSLTPTGLNLILSHYLFSINKERLFVLIGIGGLLTIVLSNYLFIPLWGLEGAAYARLLAELVLLAALSVSFFKLKGKVFENDNCI